MSNLWDIMNEDEDEETESDVNATDEETESGKILDGVMADDFADFE